MFTVIIHCTTQLTLLSPVLPSSSHSCLTLVDILKTIPGAEERKKKSNMDSLPTMGDMPSMPSKYLLLPTWVCLKSSPLTWLQTFIIFWFSGLQENGFQAIGFNSKYPSIKKSMCSMNSQYFAQKNIFIILRCSWFSPSCFLRQLCSCWKTSACTW